MIDIRAGDLVVCVADAILGRPVDQVKRGSIYRVARVMRGWDGFAYAQGLALVGMNSSPYPGYHILCFRKLNDEPDNAEIVARIKRSQPMPVVAEMRAAAVETLGEGR